MRVNKHFKVTNNLPTNYVYQLFDLAGSEFQIVYFNIQADPKDYFRVGGIARNTEYGHLGIHDKALALSNVYEDILKCAYLTPKSSFLVTQCGYVGKVPENVIFVYTYSTFLEHVVQGVPLPKKIAIIAQDDMDYEMLKSMHVVLITHNIDLGLLQKFYAHHINYIMV